MKHIFKTLLTLAGVALLFGACQTENEVLSTSITVDKATLPEFDGANPVAAKVLVTADGDWHAYYPSWITVEPANGNGNAEVPITAAPNLDNWSELMAPRADNLAFWGADDAIAYVAVSQVGEAGLDATKFFKKITKAEEFDPNFAYLIIAETKDGLLACQPCATGNDDGSYAYMFPTDVAADEDGVITMKNGSLNFFFDTVEDGYKIRQSKNNWLYMSGSYNNFYTTLDKAAKANSWTVAFNEDGFATITNISNNNKILQYDAKQYNDFGGWPEIKEGFLLPTLWKDSAPPSDEVLEVPEATYIPSGATALSLPVTANKTWKVRCHDAWIKSFTPSGEGNGTIELTFDANEGATRTATFKIIGETTNFDVTLTQFKPATCIADIVPMIVSKNSKAPSAYEATLENAVVSYVNGGSAYIEDKSGAILLYLNNHGLVAGNTISGRIFGSGYLYNGLPEITALGTEYTKGEGGEIPATEMTVKDLLAAHAANLSRRIILKGVTVTDGIDGSSDRDGKIEQDGSSIALRAQLKTQFLTAGSMGDLIAFPTVNNGTKQLAYWTDDMFIPSLIASVIKVKDVTVEAGKTIVSGATTNSPATISYTIANDGIVAVDGDGTIHGLKVGETTVLASVAAVEGYTAAEASFKVTVTEPAPAAQGYIKVEAEPANWAGTYLLVVELEGGAKAFSGFSTTSTVYGLGADVSSVMGVITNDETVAAYALQIAPATVTTGAYTIKWGSKFFNWTSGNSLNGVDAETANANWTLSFTEGHSVIRNAAENVRNLQWNAGSPRFACYGNNNQTPIQLYKLSD